MGKFLFDLFRYYYSWVWLDTFRHAQICPKLPEETLLLKFNQLNINQTERSEMILYLETEKFAKSVQIVLVSLQLILNRFSRVVDFEQILRDMFLLFLYYFISLLLFLSPLLKRKEISKFLSRIYLQLFGCYVLVLLKILQFQAYRCTSFKVLTPYLSILPPALLAKQD